MTTQGWEAPNNNGLGKDMRAAKFEIGTRFKTSGKHPRECVVTDIWSTYNKAGELVRIRYVATHEFLGQTVADCDVPEITIAKGLIA